MKPCWLSTTELQQLTARQRTSAQIRQLDAMGIGYRMRTDGSIVVLRSALGEIPQRQQGNDQQPDLSMI